MKNILFEKSVKDILVCRRPDSKDVFFDVKHEPSIAIIDSDKERLKDIVGGLIKSLTDDENFEIVGFDDGCMSTGSNAKVFDYAEFDAVISEMSNEIKARYKLFDNNKVKNINDYNNKIGLLRHIVVMIGCLNEKTVNKIAKNTSLYDLLYKGRAAGVFTCIYSTIPIRLNRENLPEYPFSAIPFSIDFIDYEQTYEMLRNDELFNRAIEIVKANGIINESVLQKRLRIGQSKASLYITAMQKLGIISKESYKFPHKKITQIKPYRFNLRY